MRVYPQREKYQVTPVERHVRVSGYAYEKDEKVERSRWRYTAYAIFYY
jgi:hypothetical protein